VQGDYFALAPGAPLRVERLVYPLPAGAGLGIHVTLDLGGRVRFGPDAEYVDRVRYDVDPAKAALFAAAAGPLPARAARRVADPRPGGRAPEASRARRAVPGLRRRDRAKKRADRRRETRYGKALRRAGSEPVACHLSWPHPGQGVEPDVERGGHAATVGRAPLQRLGSRVRPGGPGLPHDAFATGSRRSRCRARARGSGVRSARANASEQT